MVHLLTACSCGGCSLCSALGEPLRTWDPKEGRTFWISYFPAEQKHNQEPLPLIPGGASGKEFTCQSRRSKSRGFNTWVGKIP